MTYIDDIALQIAREAGAEPDDIQLYRLYALLALTVGENVTSEHVHDAWSAWRAATNPHHPSIAWFDDLPPAVQALDQPYVDAIRAVVRRIRQDGAA